MKLTIATKFRNFTSANNLRLLPRFNSKRIKKGLDWIITKSLQNTAKIAKKLQRVPKIVQANGTKTSTKRVLNNLHKYCKRWKNYYALWREEENVLWLASSKETAIKACIKKTMTKYKNASKLLKFPFFPTLALLDSEWHDLFTQAEPVFSWLFCIVAALTCLYFRPLVKALLALK